MCRQWMITLNRRMSRI